MDVQIVYSFFFKETKPELSLSLIFFLILVLEDESLQIAFFIRYICSED